MENFFSTEFVPQLPQKAAKPEIYTPKFSERQKGAPFYHAVIRLLPTFKESGNPNMPISIVPSDTPLKHTSHFVKDIAGVNRSFTCPKTHFGAKKSPLAELYFNLKKKGEVYEMRAKRIDYNRYNYVYAIVVEDAQKPEMVGKVVVFRLPKSILTKIENELNGYGKAGAGIRRNVFDPLNGADLELEITSKDGQDSSAVYDGSNFVSQSSSLPLLDNGRIVRVPTQVGPDGKQTIAPEHQLKVARYLLDNKVGDIYKFAPTEWTEEDYADVEKVIATLSDASISIEIPSKDSGSEQVKAGGSANALFGSPTPAAPSASGLFGGPVESAVSSSNDDLDGLF